MLALAARLPCCSQEVVMRFECNISSVRNAAEDQGRRLSRCPHAGQHVRQYHALRRVEVDVDLDGKPSNIEKHLPALGHLVPTKDLRQQRRDGHDYKLATAADIVHKSICGIFPVLHISDLQEL